MRKPYVTAVVILGLAVAAACGRDGDDTDAPDDRPDAGTGVVGGPTAPDGLGTLAGDTVVHDDIVYTPRDVEIFEETVEWARSEGVDTLEIGSMMARIGRRFVGDPYTPYTLDPPGPERLIVNLREFDCVTYLESVLAMARVIRADQATFPAFTGELRSIRYRDGRLDGYVSRLHYFSEWIADNEELGLLRNVTAELGGVPQDERIDFMSTNAEAYANLDGKPERISAIREIERHLSARPRAYIPERAIDDVADGIRDGDIIAATSSIEGLDVAHTGLALHIDGRLHLMHAPLVGSSVEISEVPLARRILGIDGQDGIMVARPL